MSARPQPLPDWARKFRPPVDRVALGLGTSDANRQSIAFGVVATLIVNVLLFLAPGQFLGANLSILPNLSEEVELEIDEGPADPPPELVMEPVPEPSPPKVVQTNPNTPDQPPPETQNESDRDQRAANELTPTALSEDHSPARDGIDLPTERILAGNPFESPPVPPPLPEGEPAPEVIPSAPTERNPLPGTTEDQGESPEGIGSSPAPRTADARPVDERREGARDENPDTLPPLRPAPVAGSRDAPQAPRPRVDRTSPGSAQRQMLGVAQTGTIEVDARFSEFGEYINRLVDAVGQRWGALCSSRSYGERGSHVVIRFTLTRDGNVHHLVTLERSSQSVGEFICRTSIEQGQPFGAWTDDMVAKLRAEEPIALTFYYW